MYNVKTDVDPGIPSILRYINTGNTWMDYSEPSLLELAPLYTEWCAGHRVIYGTPKTLVLNPESIKPGNQYVYPVMVPNQKGFRPPFKQLSVGTRKNADHIMYSTLLKGLTLYMALIPAEALLDALLRISSQAHLLTEAHNLMHTALMLERAGSQEPYADSVVQALQYESMGTKKKSSATDICDAAVIKLSTSQQMSMLSVGYPTRTPITPSTLRSISGRKPKNIVNALTLIFDAVRDRRVAAEFGENDVKAVLARLMSSEERSGITELIDTYRRLHAEPYTFWNQLIDIRPHTHRIKTAYDTPALYIKHILGLWNQNVQWVTERPVSPERTTVY